MIYVYNISLEKNHMISYSYILNYYIQIYTTVLFCLPWEVDTIRWLPLQPRDSIQKKTSNAIHLDSVICLESNPCYPSWWPSLYKTSSVIWWSCAACQSFSSEGKTTAFIIEKAMILHVQHVWWCLSLISEVHSWMQGVSHFLWKVEKTQQDVMYPGE